MKTNTFLLPTALLAALSSAVLAVPNPPLSRPGNLIPHQHDQYTIQIDLAIVSALDNLFTTGGLSFDTTSGLLTTPAAEEELITRRSPEELFKRQASATRNDLINGLCADTVIIYARGTNGEGNLGAALGPTFINQMTARKGAGKVIGQGVMPYKADVFGYLAGGSSEGANSMVTLVQRAASQCPGARIVLGGYSQGGQVVHLAAKRLSSSLYSRIAAIVTFGDPKRDEAFPSALQSKALVICNSGDLICDGLPIILGPHGAAEYEKRLPEVINFVAART